MSANQLAAETSPYLLQHQDNPVHWRPWGPEALAEARRTDRPILLSIGYAACHWCHVMAHESFEDPNTAEVMNDLFVNIKVDREERPDIDAIYMAALHMFGEQGGWPMTMFLAPDGKPFWGGTYFPPEPRWGRPAFRTVLTEVERIFRQDRSTIDHNRQVVTERLAAAAAEGGGDTLDISAVDRAARSLVRVMDPDLGGTRGSPKFPQFALFELLARYGIRHTDERFVRIFVDTMRHIFQGGIWDHLGGGLARYSVDGQWLVPHFEKMLYDNARAVDALVLAWQITREPLFRTRIEEIVTWLQREMTTDDGAFASSLDADSDGEEGRFYVWSRDEVEKVLGPDTADLFCRHYDVSQSGNWEGNNILNRSASSGPADEETEDELSRARSLLLEARALRQRPARDDKVLTDWNGLAISALAGAGALFARPDWIHRAATVFRSVAESAPAPGRLPHSRRADRIGANGLAGDYANMARAALTLYEATGDADYVAMAELWLQTLDRDFADTAGGYFLAPASADDLIVRPRSAADDPAPNANAVILDTMARLECFTGNSEYGRRAEALGRAFSAMATTQPFGHAFFLNAAERAIRPLEVVVTGETGDQSRAPLTTTARSAPAPTLCLSQVNTLDRLPDGHPARTGAGAGKPAAYVCADRRCSLPVSDTDELTRLINRSLTIAET